MGWVVNTTLRPLYRGKDTRYPFYRKLGGPQRRSVCVWKISPSTGILSPDRRARSERLYLYVTTVVLNLKSSCALPKLVPNSRHMHMAELKRLSLPGINSMPVWDGDVLLWDAVDGIWRTNLFYDADIIHSKCAHVTAVVYVTIPHWKCKEAWSIYGQVEINLLKNSYSRNWNVAQDQTP
jgi:hypothetical protein